MADKVKSKGFMERLRRFLPRGRTLKREEITELLEESINKTAEIDANESTMLTNILKLNAITAEHVMVPRAAIVSVDIADGYESIFRTIIKANHSRVPVCDGSLDDVLGFLHIKDLARCIAENRRPTIKKMLRHPVFVAPTIRALDLLEEMRLKRLHLALVVDEHGGVDGLVTIEDLVEQITGEIIDEYDDDSGPAVKQHADGSVTMDARMPLERLEKMTGVNFHGEEMEEIDTVGGLVAQLARHVPAEGEIIRHPSGLEFEIIESHPRHVSKVKLAGISADSGDAPPVRHAPPQKKSPQRKRLKRRAKNGGGKAPKASKPAGKKRP